MNSKLRCTTEWVRLSELKLSRPCEARGSILKLDRALLWNLRGMRLCNLVPRLCKIELLL